MKPIIYLYQEQLQGLLNAEAETAGVAFGWKGEDVYHAFLESPRVPLLGGVPSLCLFYHGDDSIESVISNFVNANHIQSNSGNIIGIRYFIEQTVVLKKGVVFDGDGFSEAEVRYVPTKNELYTRSKGLLEIDTLEKKSVLIVGLGSGGSNIVVELAKAGVGNFTLVDFDRIELHNVIRHICGVNDLGRLKVNAVRDAILLKNPYAKIKTYDFDMNNHIDVIENEIIAADLTIPATDNLKSRFLLNELLLKHRKTGIFGRVVTRAEGGDVLRVRPDGPCYACIKGRAGYNHEEEISDMKRARENGIIPEYTSEEDAQIMVQVGLSTDIAPINTMVVKMALLELSRGTKSEICSLDNELTYDYYMWANRRDNHYKKWVPFNDGLSENAVTILRWYGINISNKKCMVCDFGE